MVVIVPCIRTVAALFGADISGSSILAASVLLGIMILPTVIGVSEAALRAVPSAYYEGAVAMGARHERAIFTVMLPAANPACSQALFSASAAPSARPWRSSWSQATSRA